MSVQSKGQYIFVKGSKNYVWTIKKVDQGTKHRVDTWYFGLSKYNS